MLELLNLLTLAISFLVGVCAYQVIPFFPLLTTAIISLGLLVFRRHRALYCLLFIVLGALYCHIRSEPYTDIESLLGKTVDITFVCSDTTDGLSAAIREADLIALREAATGQLIRLRAIRIFAKAPVFREGYIYRATASVARDSFYLTPGTYQQSAVMYIEDLHEIGENRQGLLQSIRGKLNSQIDSVLSMDSAAFIKAIVTGERSNMPQDIREAFNKTGLAHILSISGAHFGLLFFIVFWSLKTSLSLLPERPLTRLALYISPATLSALLSFPLIVFYLLLSSMTYPTIRAFIMITFFLAGLLIERSRYISHSLMLAALIIVLIEPSSVSDLSFQLSFLSVLSIAVFTVFFRPNERDRAAMSATERGLSALTGSVIISLSATIGTAALVAYHFHYFSLISPMSNLFITPFIGFVLLPLSLLSSMVFIIGQWFPIATVIDWLTVYMLSTVRSLSETGWADVPVPSFPLIVVVLSVLSIIYSAFIVLGPLSRDVRTRGTVIRVVATIIAPCLVYTLYWFNHGDRLSVTFLDVGQGDSALVELPDKRVIAIDTGKNGYVLSRYLRYRGIREIDAIVISHPQRDHAGGLLRLLREFRVGEVWDNGFVSYPLEGIRTVSLSRGDRLEGNGYEMLVLHPHIDFRPEKNPENNLSLVIKLIGRGGSFLFTGDIEREAIDDLIHTGTYLKSRVLKFPHHGSAGSLDEEFMRLVSPEIVVISSGRLNRYNLPSPETITALQGIRVFRTDLDGAIRISEAKGGELSALTARDFSLRKVSDLSDEWRNIKRLFSQW